MKSTISYAFLAILLMPLFMQPSAAPEDVEKQKLLHAAAQQARRDAAAQEYRQHIRDAMQQPLHGKLCKNNTPQSHDRSASQDDEKEQDDHEITALLDAHESARHLLIAEPSEKDDEDEIELIRNIAYRLPFTIDRIIYSFLRPSILDQNTEYKITPLPIGIFATTAISLDSKTFLISSENDRRENPVIRIYNSNGEQLGSSNHSLYSYSLLPDLDKTVIKIPYCLFGDRSKMPPDIYSQRYHQFRYERYMTDSERECASYIHDFTPAIYKAEISEAVEPMVSPDNQFMIRWVKDKHIMLLYTALPWPSIGAYLYAQPFMSHAQELRAQAKSIPSFPATRMTKINYGIARLKQSITSQQKDLENYITLIHKRTKAEFAIGEQEAQRKNLKNMFPKKNCTVC